MPIIIKISEIKICFFEQNWNTVCLKQDGTVPVCKDPQIIESKLNEMEGSTFISSLVGTTLREQLVGFIFKILSDRSTDEIA